MVMFPKRYAPQGILSWSDLRELFVSAHVAALSNIGQGHLFVLVIYSAGSRSAWNVRVSRGTDSVVALRNLKALAVKLTAANGCSENTAI